jgi:hypothetical protein
VAILSSWLFAWRLSPGVNSVGVPVEELPPVSAPAEPAPPIQKPVQRPTPEAAAPPVAPIEKAPTLDTAPAPEATGALPPEAAPHAKADAAPPKVQETAARAPVVRNPIRRVNARAAPRSLAPPIPAAPPVRDPALVEAPVEVASARFPQEHVPPSLREEPLAAPPAGPRLSVNATPWASIRLDGNEVGETPLGELRLTPGPHVVSATLPDGRVIERRVEAKAGDLYLVFP